MVDLSDGLLLFPAGIHLSEMEQVLECPLEYVFSTDGIGEAFVTF